jgi:hypothetical protein
MSSVEHFPGQFAGLKECPDPFREPLRYVLNPSEAILDIVHRSKAKQCEDTGW